MELWTQIKSKQKRLLKGKINILKKQTLLIVAINPETIQINLQILVTETLELIHKKKPELIEMVKNSEMIEKTENQDTIKMMMTENCLMV